MKNCEQRKAPPPFTYDSEAEDIRPLQRVRPRRDADGRREERDDMALMFADTSLDEDEPDSAVSHLSVQFTCRKKISTKYVPIKTRLKFFQ